MEELNTNQAPMATTPNPNPAAAPMSSTNLANGGGLTANQVANQGQEIGLVNQLKEETTLPPTPAPPVTAQAEAQPNFGKSELLDAGKILKEILGMQIGNVVGDLGAGGGMFSMAAARTVGDQGQVYAVDIIKSSLSEIESKARMSGLYNLKTIWSNLEIVGATKIKEASLDFALVVNVLFQSQKKYEILAEATRLLKVGGKMLIIDWSNTAPGFAPPAEMQVNKEELLKICEQLELSLVEDFRAGNYHFGLIFRK